ncbi:hypothetical protein CVT25_014060 [Psilocybe cyanescens]|uniref:Anaphase-promoting complex subunit 4 WD40 domain-containing protein n=1 Tax=Psilocybe cyanescens TaxID=93625 RepID=A0A409X1N3_PSICY|nr:hypothetical protein CVT25_014060 [Psilocybe cyanescens]
MEPSSQTWASAEYNTSKYPGLYCTLNVISNASFQSNFPRSAKCVKHAHDAYQGVLMALLFLHCVKIALSNSSTLVERIATPLRQFAQAAPILDFIWYPTATPLDPASFCFVAAVRECPVKLLDASDGRLRASYRIVDHRERQIAPHSLAFNLTAQKSVLSLLLNIFSLLISFHRLYCGFEDAIEVFDITRPGEGTRIPTTPSKKSKDGLKGIISSLAFCPSYSPDGCFYAAGSFSPTDNNIALFSDVSSEPVMFIGGGPQAGVTQVLQFNPMQPNILYATYRGKGSGSIYSWDIRSNVHVPMEIFQASTSSHKNRTNQRIRFDIDAAGRLLSIGDHTGNISIFDLNGGPNLESVSDSSFENTKLSQPCLTFKAHEAPTKMDLDTIGSVAFHPLKPCLLSVSGSRHFTDEYSMSSDEESGDEVDRHVVHEEVKVRREKQPQPVAFDSTIKAWDFT